MKKITKPTTETEKGEINMAEYSPMMQHYLQTKRRI